MSALQPSASSGTTPRRRRLPRWVIGLAVVAALGVLGTGASWLLTEPLVDHPVPPLGVDAPSAPLASSGKVDDGPPAWPEGRMEGEEAKKILLASALRSVDHLGRIKDYTATLRKHERINGILGPEQTLAMKVRNDPFAIYLKFLAPKAGKEVVFAEGHHENKVVAHSGDWTRRLIPRLAVPLDSPLALADSRHPVNEAGLLALARKLLMYRRMDVGDSLAETVIDRTTDPDGKPALRSVHVHSDPNAGRPFVRVEILYEPATQYPIRIDSYDWAAPGHVGPLDLAESFYYTDIKLNAALTGADFDINNPAYEFMRF